jgi:hypothetical protein
VGHHLGQEANVPERAQQRVLVVLQREASLQQYRQYMAEQLSAIRQTLPHASCLVHAYGRSQLVDGYHMPGSWSPHATRNPSVLDVQPDKHMR